MTPLLLLLRLSRPLQGEVEFAVLKFLSEALFGGFARLVCDKAASKFLLLGFVYESTTKPLVF